MLHESIAAGPFDENPEFYELDNRKFREWNPVTKEVLEKKHRALLPPSMLSGKKVLDLGSCMGATGQWCLFYGAESYTGVEVQGEYAEAARTFLAHYGRRARIVQSSIPDFLSENTEKFDIVCMFGVIYVFVDYYKILSAIAEISNEYVVIEGLYPKDVPKKFYHLPLAEFIPNQRINMANKEASLVGFWTRMTPLGLRFVMSTLGFFSPEWVLPVEKINGTFDWYMPPPDLHESQKKLQATFRYLMRFQKTDQKVEDLARILVSGGRGKIEPWNSVGKPPEIIKIPNSEGEWAFDDSVAKGFECHARQHIPDYERVISLCLKIAGKRFSKETAKILDIWSAIGFTLKRFSDAGFRNVFWVEASQSMIRQSWSEKAKIVFSAEFPKDLAPFDFVMANWTLHFIRDNRYGYLSEIFEGLSPGWCLVISDKMAPSDLTTALYHDFKREQGVSEDEIRKKDEAIRGVLIPYPMEWYLKSLREIGFSTIEVVNASPCFVTILAMKA